MEILELQKRIAPEIVEIIERRYLILRTILSNQPIGRRSLSGLLGLSERIIRDEVNILKDQGLLNISLMGMNITDDGGKIIEELRKIYIELKGIPQLKQKLAKVLKAKKIIIVPSGTIDKELALKDMGKIASNIIKQVLKPKDILGITGGTTMAAIAREMTPENRQSDIIVVPARGGLGKNLETQANSIAAKLGEKLGGTYKLLYVPDTLDNEALEAICKNQEISEAIELINQIDVLVFGIGRADTMARRRNLDAEKLNFLSENSAVAEAFGHYFDINGNEILEHRTIGLTINKFKEIPNIIGVAGGEDKAQAIIAISSLRDDMILVTDESAAKKILELVDNAT